MSKRRYIKDSFRSDGWIEDLDPLERYLYLYLITNEYVNCCGIYEIKTRRMAFETGIDEEMIKKMIGRFQEAKKVFYNSGIIFIVNFVRNQSVNSESDNLRKGIVREVKELGQEKINRVIGIEGAYKVVEGAYKDVGIPYFTLLNFTLLNSNEGDSKSDDNYRSFKHLKISLQEFDKLIALGYTKLQVDDILDRIENFKQNKKYTSLYLTSLTRIRKQYPEQEKESKKRKLSSAEHNARVLASFQ